LIPVAVEGVEGKGFGVMRCDVKGREGDSVSWIFLFDFGMGILLVRGRN
jgi:hypothetical protein